MMIRDSGLLLGPPCICVKKKQQLHYEYLWLKTPQLE